MSKNLTKKNNSLFQDFFNAPSDSEDKAWDFIGDFFHMILTHMENENIKKVDLAKRLDVSRSRISQLFNETPNISIKKMFKIADAVNLEIKITSDKVDILKEEYEANQFELIEPLIDHCFSTYSYSDQKKLSFKNVNKKSLNNIEKNSPCGFSVDYPHEYIGA